MTCAVKATVNVDKSLLTRNQQNAAMFNWSPCILMNSSSYMDLLPQFLCFPATGFWQALRWPFWDRETFSSNLEEKNAFYFDTNTIRHLIFGKQWICVNIYMIWDICILHIFMDSLHCSANHYTSAQGCKYLHRDGLRIWDSFF